MTWISGNSAAEGAACSHLQVHTQLDPQLQANKPKWIGEISLPKCVQPLSQRTASAECGRAAKPSACRRSRACCPVLLGLLHLDLLLERHNGSLAGSILGPRLRG